MSTSTTDAEFPYPLPIKTGAPVESDSDITDNGVTFLNAADGILFLLQEAALAPKDAKVVTVAAAASSDDDAATSSTSSSSCSLLDSALRARWYQYEERVVPGGVMTMVKSFTYASPKGLRTVTSNKVNAVFNEGKRYLVDYIPPPMLQRLSYLELDELRYALLALSDLIVTEGGGNKVFASKWSLTGFAKRDIRKNCSSSAAESDTAATEAGDGSNAQGGKGGHNNKTSGGTGSSGLLRTDPGKGATPKASTAQKHMKGLLEDACTTQWPFVPSHKSAVFTLEQDPKAPRHKPLFRATVELTQLKAKANKSEGPWMGNKKDAEDAAAELALKLFHSMTSKK